MMKCNKQVINGLTAVVAAAVIAIPVTVGYMAYHTASHADRAFNQLNDSFYQLAFADDVLNSACHGQLGLSKQQALIQQRTRLENFITATYAVGHLISHGTFEKLYAFDRYNNAIQASKATCSELRSPSWLVAIKHNLLSAINQDQIGHQGIRASISDLLSHPQVYKYSIKIS